MALMSRMKISALLAFAVLLSQVSLLAQTLQSTPQTAAQPSSQPQTTPSADAPTSTHDYKYSLSPGQPWIDTGLALRKGDVLKVSASAAAKSAGNDCVPEGSSMAAPDTAPVPGAHSGALIAKLQQLGDAFLIGASKEIKVESPGHLFFGVNGPATPACTGDIAISVNYTTAQLIPGKTPAPSAAVAPGTTPGKGSVRDKLNTAAQTWLQGQFGTNANQQSAAAGATSNPALGTTAAPATSGLMISTAPLDAALTKDLQSLPRRVNDEFHNPGDMVNFVLVGSKEQVQSALTAASWHIADTKNNAAVANAVLQTINKEDYLAMPMSQLMLFGRFQDFGYEQAAAYSVVASRHHFRLWKAPFTYNGQDVWVGAGTHDIGFEKDQRNGKVTHKIDPAVDGERENIAQSLQAAGKVKSMQYFLPSDRVQDAHNATGGSFHSDGRMIVMFLQ
jgi:hypothetical protein